MFFILLLFLGLSTESTSLSPSIHEGCSEVRRFRVFEDLAVFVRFSPTSSFTPIDPSFMPCSSCRGLCCSCILHSCESWDHLGSHQYYLDSYLETLYNLQPCKYSCYLQADDVPSARSEHQHHKAHGGNHQVQEFFSTPAASSFQAPDGKGSSEE